MTDVEQKAIDYALSYACRAGDYEIAAYALSQGANPNCGRNHTLSPLHGALTWCKKRDEGERIRIVMLLLEHGADVNIRDREGCTPLYDAIERNVAAAVRILVAWGADVERIDGLGRSLREVALDMGRWEILQLLAQLMSEMCIE